MSLTSVARSRLQATIACAVALALGWRIQNAWTLSIAGVATLLAALAWFAPAGYAAVQTVLGRLGRTALVCITWCLLGVIYFGLLTPMHLWRVLARVDPLQLRPAPRNVGSLLRPVRLSRPDRFERQF